MKPLGMTADFRITRPTRIEDKIYDAVEAAVDGGWTPEQIIREIRDDWALYMAEKTKADAKAFDKALLRK